MMDTLLFTGKIALAALLGGLIGLQRHRRGKAAGIRTYALVALGSALFTIISFMNGGGDPGRIAAQIVSGIGFIGAGTIIHRGGGVEGLTTAAGLWASAAIGMAVGVDMFLEAIITSVIMLCILFIQEKKRRTAWRRLTKT